MGALSSFVLPLVVGVGIYFLLLVVFPTMNSLSALLIGIATAWGVRVAIKKIHP